MAGALLLLAAAAAACTSGKTGAPAMEEIESGRDYYQLLGVVAHHTPREDADPELTAVWHEIDSLLATELVDEGSETMDGMREMANRLSVFVQRAQTRSLRLDSLASRGEDDEVFADMAKGAVFEHLSSELRSLPMPSSVSGNQDAEAMFRGVLDEHASGVTRIAREAYQGCAVSGDERGTVCASKVEELAELAAPAPSPAPSRAQPSTGALTAATGPLPEECGARTFSFSFADPIAPPPDYDVPPVVAVLHDRLPVEGNDLEELLSRASAAVQEHTGLPLVDREEVLAARRLVRERRWSEEGPVCGQPPPLEALLAEAHPHLVIATISIATLLPSLPDDPMNVEEEGRSYLAVDFRRAGQIGEAPEGVDPLPGAFEAEVEDREDPAELLEAAGSLSPDTSHGGLLGVLGSEDLGTPSYLHVREREETDPWLRVGRTLAGAARDDLLACYPGPGAASFELSWTISESGQTLQPRVEVRSPPPTYGAAPGMDDILEEARECMEQVLSSTAWPCPRGASPVEAGALVCTGLAD